MATHREQEARMYARLVSFSGADPSNRDRAVQNITENVVPMLRQVDGYAGYVALYDGPNQRAKGLVLWETKEAAEAAEEQLSERRRQIAGEMGLTVEAADLYEAPVIDFEGARV
jgi:hypothetical protein